MVDSPAETPPEAPQTPEDAPQAAEPGPDDPVSDRARKALWGMVKKRVSQAAKDGLQPLDAKRLLVRVMDAELGAGKTIETMGDAAKVEAALGNYDVETGDRIPDPADLPV